jgi:hypothetical protein
MLYKHFVPYAKNVCFKFDFYFPHTENYACTNTYLDPQNGVQSNKTCQQCDD